MDEVKYSVIDDFGHPLACDMALQDALLFVEALFNKYYESSISYTIRKQRSDTTCINN